MNTKPLTLVRSFIIICLTPFPGMNQTFAINEEGKAIAEIPISSNTAYLNNKLYDKKENKIIELDLSSLFNKGLKNN